MSFKSANNRQVKEKEKEKEKEKVDKFSEIILSVEKVWKDDELVVIPWWIYPMSYCVFVINALYSTV